MVGVLPFASRFEEWWTKVWRHGGGRRAAEPKPVVGWCGWEGPERRRRSESFAASANWQPAVPHAGCQLVADVRAAEIRPDWLTALGSSSFQAPPSQPARS